VSATVAVWKLLNLLSATNDDGPIATVEPLARKQAVANMTMRCR